ncbi:MAG: TolC family protein [Bacteroidales bacterium]|jgi:outer membrane protein TolC|nr:TolC family protein [Bacteroidales bacterium]MBR5912710.1 TolC family protein [Bacteroidales bacterium]
MNKSHIIILLFALLITGAKAQTPVLTLDSCFALAKANNVQMQTAQLEIEKAQQVKAQVFTKYFPQVSISSIGFFSARPFIEFGINDIQDDDLSAFLSALITSLNDPEGLNMGLPTEINLMQAGHSVNATALVPVYAGGRIMNGNRLANVGVEAARLKAEVSERDMLENIESSYYLVLGLKDKVRTLESALALTDSLERIVDVALRAGLITKSDKLRLSLKQNELKAKQMQLGNSIVLASQLLCQQIGIDYPEAGLTLDTAGFASNPTLSVVNEDFVRPEHQLLQLQVDAERLRKKLTLGEALPQVGVGGTFAYGFLIRRYKANAIALAQVSIPLSQWWETSHKLKEHDIAIREAELMQQDLTEKMGLQVKQAYNQMVEADALLQSDKSALDMAQENYRLAELNYRAGMNTITDVLEAHALLLQAKNAITDRQISYLSARRRYHDLSGR